MSEIDIKAEYEADIGPINMLYETISTSTSKGFSIWTSAETKKLFDLYQNFINQIGPTKRFQRKKDMWIEISGHIPKKTARQCEDRFKTVLRKKKNRIKRISESRAKLKAKLKASELEADENSFNHLEGKIWSVNETQILLDLYVRLIKDVGYGKKIALKKDMWVEISKHIPGKNAKQCEERFKTVHRRQDAKRKHFDFENNISIENSIEEIRRYESNGDGQSKTDLTCNTNFEESNSHDSDANDDLMEDNMNDREEVNNEIVETITPENPPLNEVKVEINNYDGLYKILLAITEKKEEAKERRHIEKMEAIHEMKDILLQILNK